MPTISVSLDSNKTFKTRVDPSQSIQNQAEDHRLKGNSAFQANNLAEALDFYSKSLKLWEQASTYSNRSLIYFKLKDYETAIRDAGNAILIDPTFYKAYHRRGKALSQLNRNSEAV